MGNRHGHRKEESKSKGEKKEGEKEKKRQKGEKKKNKKQSLGQHVSELDTDLEDSSHVTGGDSESCVFHSAENVSHSPYLDSSTRSVHEHGPNWPDVLGQSSASGQHPYVLSSKDFHDGFSLEACIPPEIARPETYSDVSSTTWSRHRQSSFSASSGVGSPPGSDPKGSFTSGYGKDAAFSSLKFTSAAEKSEGKSFQTHQETETGKSRAAFPSSPSGHHHPHFYNHNRKYQQRDPRTMPKPSSPQPQRKALSPRLISSPLKSASTDYESSTPSTPSSSRRSSNFLALFRSGSKTEKVQKHDIKDGKTEIASPEIRCRSNSATNNSQEKVKSKPLWKTWERSRSKKAKQEAKVSIFGTSRKSDSKPDNTEMKDDVAGEIKKAETETKFTNIACKDSSFHESFNNDKSAAVCRTARRDDKNGSSAAAYVDSKSRNWVYSSSESETIVEDEPPLSKTAAFCIMKLEELERSIEKTIREKFPDAEPFLLKKRSKEELRGSRSLPTTPSLKKKLFITREEDVNTANAKFRNEKGMTRICNETYESPPIPSKSPVVLRRFGPKTRHASISPTIQRAKTAAIFNSPSEINSLDSSIPTHSAVKTSPYQRLSIQQTPGSDDAVKLDKPLTAAQKSESKYDNVMDDNDVDFANASFTPALTQVDKSDQVFTPENKTNQTEIKPVIVPSGSALFGSVSPKLKRHLELKCNEMTESIGNAVATGFGNVCSQDETCQRFDERLSQNQQQDHKPHELTPEKQQQMFTITSQQGCRQREINSLIVSKSKDNSNEERIDRAEALRGFEETQTTDRIISGKVENKSTNKKISRMGEAKDACAEVRTDDNPDLEVRYNKYETGEIRNSTEATKELSLEPTKSAHDETSPQKSDNYMGKNFENSGHVTCGAARKHSTDHVAFDSTVVLSRGTFSSSPVLSSSPGQETVSKVNNLSIAQSRVTVSHSDHISRYASEQQTAFNQQGEIRHLPLHSLEPNSTTDSLLEHSEHLSVFTHEETAAVSSFKQCDSGVPLISETHSEIGFTHSVDSDVSGTSRAEAAFPKSSVRRPHFVDHQHSPVTDNNLNQESINELNYSDTTRDNLQRHRGFQHQSQKEQQKDYYQQHTPNEERVSVFKHPVSEVISQMISLSKRQAHQQETHNHQQRQEALQQRQQALNPQLGSDHLYLQQDADPYKQQQEADHPQQQQEEDHHKQQQEANHRKQQREQFPTNSSSSSDYEALREKRARTLNYDDSSEEATSLDSRQDTIRSRCQEIQTDSFTTADKSVDSEGLTDAFVRSRLLTPGRISTSVSTSTQGVGLRSLDEDTMDITSDDTVEQTKVSENKPNDGTVIHESETSEQVPPPSPNTMQQLIEELDEEEEDDDLNIEAAANLNRDREMKQFTEVVFKRLSDLLTNRSRSESEADDDSLDNVRADEEFDSDTPSKCEMNGESVSPKKDVGTDVAASTIPTSSIIKVLTVDTSSSLTTTTSSESDVDEPPIMFHSFPNEDQKNEEAEEVIETYPERESEPKATFPECDVDIPQSPKDDDHRSASREYHSDDDVATGRGIPDYYDDRPLWSRRQKPPGQLSAAMIAIRWRERRERWLKKRRRNRTDLLSTGSSDTGSENYLAGDYSQLPDNYNDSSSRTDDLGSGILTSPKYTKPILPFFTSDRTKSPVDEESGKVTVKPSKYTTQYRQRYGNKSSLIKYNNCKAKQANRSSDEDTCDRTFAQGGVENVNGGVNNNGEDLQSSRGMNPNMNAPSIEDTFRELISVQNILMGMQESKPSTNDNSESKLLPLTTENVRSIREYYKDCYSSGNGRRSRMSATDRTESDLDLFSERRDDASSGSDVYADDEGDDDGIEPYETAEDDLSASGRGSNRSGRGGKRGGGGGEKEDGEESDASIVLSCTFYNSNTQREKINEQSLATPQLVSTNEAKTSPRSTSAVHTPISHTFINSDDEFWTGSVVMEESSNQAETTANPMSPTFQNAREQMHDIQYHLQALRRQMEFMQDDSAHVSENMFPKTFTDRSQK